MEFLLLVMKKPENYNSVNSASVASSNNAGRDVDSDDRRHRSLSSSSSKSNVISGSKRAADDVVDDRSDKNPATTKAADNHATHLQTSDEDDDDSATGASTRKAKRNSRIITADWSEINRTLLLIKEVKRRQCLWDSTSAEPASHQLRHQLWSEIAALVDIDADQCKYKWTSMRNAYLVSIHF